MAGGRPKAIIDWDLVNDLLIAGCSGAEIAGELGLYPNTIYDRCEKDHGLPFSEYSQQFYSKGNAILRRHQFLKSIGKTDVGDNTLLIWLGKTRLKQKEEQNIEQNIKVEITDYSNAEIIGPPSQIPT